MIWESSPLRGNMQFQPKQNASRRTQRRTATRIGITCRRFASIGSPVHSDGELLNYSESGAFIVTPRAFHLGTVLVVRLTTYPDSPWYPPQSTDIRSMFLGEVRWQKSVEDEMAVRYGMGLKYLL